METKDEFSEAINKMLGTEIDFTKLSKGDLESLHGALTKVKATTEATFPLLDKPLGQLLDGNSKIFGKPFRNMTLRDLMGLPKERKGGGLLGLGILSGNLLSGVGGKDEATT